MGLVKASSARGKLLAASVSISQLSKFSTNHMLKPLSWLFVNTLVSHK